MLKRIILSLIISSSLLFSNSETVIVNINEAVMVNHNLIKDLYKRIDLLEKEVLSLKNNNLSIGNEPKKTIIMNSNNSILKSDNEDLNKEGYFVSVDGLNVRTSSKVKKSNIIGRLKFGDIIICKNFKAKWCITNNGNFVWANGLKKIDRKIAIVTNTTELQNYKTLGKTKEIGKLNKGEVVDKIGNIEDWAILDNTLLINKKDIVEAK
ncbi:hypothetical protein ACNSOL_12015 (plasmid) [Aliarcobacter lanthieri]|uniref:hypothetical protein n=1 Tax=Aliarcobacter lanthieri TaxID=1355374 RepID=UPI003AAA229F